MQVFDQWGNKKFEESNLAHNDTIKTWNGLDYNQGICVYLIDYQLFSK
jgi:hypothetical protein